MSFHENLYVIEKETGHPGYQQYSITSTPEHMKELVEALSRALSEPRPEGELWQAYATIARGETSRVTLRFAVTDDLKIYHKPPGLFARLLNKIGWPFGCLFVLAILYFAWIGFQTSIEKLIPLFR